MTFRLSGSAVAAVARARWLPVLGFVILLSASLAWGEDSPSTPKDLPPVLKGQALIVVGLPGDEDHEKLFTETANKWRDWLTGTLNFSPGDVHVLFSKALSKGDSPIFAGQKSGQSPGSAAREAIEKEVARLKQTIQPDDRLWVFFLGHANFDSEHAWFHLPGPDLREDELGKLFAEIQCKEQVFWMTTAESGRFVKSLSAKGRVVIAATRAEAEDNETEFPHALSTVATRPLSALDFNNDGKLALLELYYRVIVEVQARYNADNRVPTEHAQLDDNGDGIGVERPLVADPGKKPAPGDDGMLSLITILPYPSPPPKEEPAKPIKSAEQIKSADPKP
jgi:hypothetical protein